MIWMNRKHPSFDLSMELLMSVPVDPDFVRLPDLREDLFEPGDRNPFLHAKFQKPGSVQDLLRDLSRRRYAVIVRNGFDGKGRRLWLSRDSRWEVPAATKYWNTVYGSTEDEKHKGVVTTAELDDCDDRVCVGV